MGWKERLMVCGQLIHIMFSDKSRTCIDYGDGPGTFFCNHSMEMYFKKLLEENKIISLVIQDLRLHVI